MSRLLISIPVHEQPDVVYDQIANIHRYVPEATVVLHVSAEFRRPLLRFKPVTKFVESQKLLINPVSLSTAELGLLNIYLSNWKYAATRGEFDWFLINASNDMYVRAGVGDYLERFDAVARPIALTPSSDWAHYPPVTKHSYLEALAASLGAPVSASTPEGTAYTQAFMRRAVELLGTARPYVRAPDPYPDEETVLPTLARAWATRIGPPFVLSEVTLGATMTAETVDVVRAGNFRSKPKSFYGVEGLVQPYDDAGIYAVKRVARRINDPLRVYIRSLA